MGEQNKNWLIRTKQKQILGPVSKLKILELLDKGSLKKEDELTSGNGYWFHIKETDMVEKYIRGDLPQTFNPISEAPTVLAIADQEPEVTLSINPKPRKMVHEELQKELADNEEEASDITQLISLSDLSKSTDLQEKPDEGILPDEGDLEYPDLSSGEEVDDITRVDFSFPKDLDPPTQKSLEPVSTVEEEEDDLEEGKLPPSQDLEYPSLNMEVAGETQKQELPKVTTLKKSGPPRSNQQAARIKRRQGGTISRKIKIKRNIEPPKQRNDNYLLIVLGFLVILVIGIFYFYKKVLHRPLPIFGKHKFPSIIRSVYADNEVSSDLLVKKKP